MRNSRQKDIVLSALDEYRVHPTADELYKYIHINNTEIGLATVYRNLNKLAEKGIIRKIIGLDGSSHFDSCPTPHYHFVCGCCGKIYDIPGEIAKDLIAKAEEFTDCKITSMDITFRGMCKSCEEKHTTQIENTKILYTASTS